MAGVSDISVSYTHLRAHETPEHLVCRLLLEKKKKKLFYVYFFFFFLMIRRPPRSTLDRSSAASDVYKRQAYDRINKEALWQVLVIYGVGSRLLNGIKSMYDDSGACVRINGVNGDWFRINSGVRQGCVMSPWLFNLYMDGVM